MIAAVEGWALGGGFELALACDLIVATEDARFGFPEVTHGLVASEGGLIRLPRRMPYEGASGQVSVRENGNAEHKMTLLLAERD